MSSCCAEKRMPRSRRCPRALCRRKNSRVLCENRQEWKAIFDSSQDGVLVADIVRRKFLSGNRKIASMLGFSERELLRLSVKDIHPPQALRRALTGFDLLARGRTSVVTNIPVRRKNGSLFYADISGSCAELFGRSCLVGFFRDVTERKRVEADLQASEQRYRGIFESSHDAMMTLEPPSWKFTTANAAMVRMFRAKSVARLLFHSPWVLSPKRQPDGGLSAEKAQEMIQTAIRKGAYFFEWTHRRLDGTTFPAEVLLTRMTKNGHVTLQATVRDITARKQAEEALRSSERRTSDLMANLPGMAYRCRNERDWPMFFVSEGCRALTGFGKKDFESCRVLYNELIDREDRRRIWKAVQQALAQKTYFEFIYKIRTKTQAKKWVWERGHGVWNDAGKLMYLDGFVTDITARKQAEDSLEEHRHQLLQIIDTVPHMIFAKDRKGRFLLVNRALARAYGAEPQDLIGVRRQDIHKVREEIKGYLKNDREVLAKGRPKVTAGEFFTDVQGRRHILQTIKIPFKMVGANEPCILGVSVDITEQKKIEEFRNDIVRTVSHELRTPLSIQKEGISLLLDGVAGAVSPEQKKILNAVMRNIDRLARMIASLLDISSIESGRISLAKRETDLADLVRDVVSGFNVRADERSISLSVKLPRQPIRVFADPDKIAQVLSNMVDNALKFTPAHGAVEVSLTVRGGDVECEVRDTGIGIASEHLGKIFEKFQQFARVAGPGEKGFGLGLSIVKGIMDLHGGRVRVQSKLGQGTCVAFSLPVCADREPGRVAGQIGCHKKEAPFHA